MLNEALIYGGSIMITAWGIAHIVPVKRVVAGFGPIAQDNQYIITMTWVSEGLALCFIGLLTLVSTVLEGAEGSANQIVYAGSAIMLLVGAIWTARTGARTPVLPMKICPYVKTLAAVLFLVGSVV